MGIGVTVGAVDGLIREGLEAACSPELVLRSTAARGRWLIAEARIAGSTVVIATPDDITPLRRDMPDDLLLIGICDESTTLQVVAGGIETAAPATPRHIAELVRSWDSSRGDAWRAAKG